VSPSTNTQSRSDDYEVDLIPMIQALWASKITIVATTASGAAIALSIYAATPEQWTASTYITKSSLYSLYNEIEEQGGSSDRKNQLLEPMKLYSSIQNEMFYTAMGVMAAKSVTLKETPPGSAANESPLYIASFTTTTAAQAATHLKAVMERANTEAVALSVPTMPPDKNLKAFNVLDEVKTSPVEKSKKNTFLGALLGLFLSSAYVIGRFLARHCKKRDLC
jgi:hypothetical protein